MSKPLAKPHPQKLSRAVVVSRKGGRLRTKDSIDGVVRHCVRGPSSKTAAAKFTSAKLIAVVQAGLLFQELDDLRASLALSMDKLAPKLGISRATLHRRKAEGRLGPAESDRVVRFARLMGKAVEVLESDEAARQWLISPQVGLGGAAPLDYAETEVGAREVEDLLVRIEYNVYS
jgi:putative toxin-antitoxin system antitoxin component (TIGR02293 family)